MKQKDKEKEKKFRRFTWKLHSEKGQALYYRNPYIEFSPRTLRDVVHLILGTKSAWCRTQTLNDPYMDTCNSMYIGADLRRVGSGWPSEGFGVCGVASPGRR